MSQSINTLRIGLTGGIASGKSSAANAFKQFGIDVISADEIAKDLLKKNSPALKQVVQAFGSDILTVEAELDRIKLRELIFKDEKKRERLNSITHPEIRKEMVRLAQNSISPYVILEIPLLIESGLNKLVNKILVITSPENTQIQRIMQRDNCSNEQAISIINAQTSNQVRLQHADDCIDNSGSITKLNKQVHLLHNKYMNLINKSHTKTKKIKSTTKMGLDLH